MNPISILKVGHFHHARGYEARDDSINRLHLLQKLFQRVKEIYSRLKPVNKSVLRLYKFVNITNPAQVLPRKLYILSAIHSLWTTISESENKDDDRKKR